MNVANHLKIKFGLRYDPSPVEIEAWQQEVIARIARGEDPEEASKAAAFEHFEGVDSCVYGAEADNIQALLQALAKKSGN